MPQPNDPTNPAAPLSTTTPDPRLNRLEELAMYSEQELAETRKQMGELFTQLNAITRRLAQLETSLTQLELHREKTSDADPSTDPHTDALDPSIFPNEKPPHSA